MEGEVCKQSSGSCTVAVLDYYSEEKAEQSDFLTC